MDAILSNFAEIEGNKKELTGQRFFPTTGMKGEYSFDATSCQANTSLMVKKDGFYGSSRGTERQTKTALAAYFPGSGAHEPDSASQLQAGAGSGYKTAMRKGRVPYLIPAL